MQKMLSAFKHVLPPAAKLQELGLTRKLIAQRAKSSLELTYAAGFKRMGSIRARSGTGSILALTWATAAYVDDDCSMELNIALYDNGEVAMHTDQVYPYTHGVYQVSVSLTGEVNVSSRLFEYLRRGQ